MKLSNAQLVHIRSELKRMDARLKDLESFGDDIYKSRELSAERSRIYYNQWFFNHILRLHNVEIQAEKASIEELTRQIEEEFADGIVK